MKTRLSHSPAEVAHRRLALGLAQGLGWARGSPLEVALSAVARRAAPLGLQQGRAGAAPSPGLLDHLPPTLHLADTARLGALAPRAPLTHPAVPWGACTQGERMVPSALLHA